MTHRRRGRPASDRPAVDRGTVETQEKRLSLLTGFRADLTLTGRERARLALAAANDNEAAGNAAAGRASYPLGVLLARGLILQADHDAGLRYERLYRQAIGRRTGPAASTSGERGMPTAGTGGDQAARRSYLAARERLEGCGARAARIVDDVAVYHAFPAWLDPAARRRRGAAAQLDALQAGLDALARLFGLVR